MAEATVERGAVIAVLETVMDPELNLDIWNLGLIYEVKPADHKVDIEMTLTSPMCPYGPQLISETQTTVEAMDQVDEVNIEIVWDPPWSMDMMSEDLKFMLGRG